MFVPDTNTSQCGTIEKRKAVSFVEGIQTILHSKKTPRERFHQIALFLKNCLWYGTVSFNLNSKRYWNKKLGSFGDFWRDENYHHIVDLFPQNESFHLLDVGCALGDGCAYLQRHFPLAHITGIDISEVGIRKAQEKKKGITYAVLDIVAEPVPRAFDYITLIEVLEHFERPFEILDKCLAKATRAVIVSVPYTPEYTGPCYDRVDEHRYSFNESTLIQYCTARVVKITDIVSATQSRCIIYEITPP